MSCHVLPYLALSCQVACKGRKLCLWHTWLDGQGQHLWVLRVVVLHTLVVGIQSCRFQNWKIWFGWQGITYLIIPDHTWSYLVIPVKAFQILILRQHVVYCSIPCKWTKTNMFTFHCSAKRNMIQIKPVVGCTVPKKENMLKATERDIGSTWQPDLLRRNQCNKASFAATCDERITCCCYLVLIVMIHILGCSHYLQNHTTIQGMWSHLVCHGRASDILRMDRIWACRADSPAISSALVVSHCGSAAS